MTLPEELKNNFVIVNLGAGGDFDYNLSPEIRASTTLIEIDAADSSKGDATYFRREKLKNVVAGKAGKQDFTIHKYIACSSLREPDKELIKKYGLHDYYEIVNAESVECETLPNLLASLDINRVDFLKTDLEGEDFAVIKSMDLNKVLTVQAELRFEPFYAGEPYISEVIEYLRTYDIELIGLRPEYWKPAASFDHEDGKIVWADCLFLKKTRSPLDIAKQIIILSMLGRRGYAAYLEAGVTFPDLWKPEIEKLTIPIKRTWRNFARGVYYKVRNFNKPAKLKHLARR